MQTLFGIMTILIIFLSMASYMTQMIFYHLNQGFQTKNQILIHH